MHIKIKLLTLPGTECSETSAHKIQTPGNHPKEGKQEKSNNVFSPLNAKLNPICHLLVLIGAHPILHVSRIRVKKSEKCS
jgi:hypothetical protein